TATNPLWQGTITDLRIDPGHYFQNVKDSNGDPILPSADNPYIIKLAQVSIIYGETVQKINPEDYDTGTTKHLANITKDYTKATETQLSKPFKRISAKVSGDDPQIQYNGLNINAAEVKGIVIRAYIPSNKITKNAFQLFFANEDGEEFSKDKKFTVFYDTSQKFEDFDHLYFDLSKVDKYNSGDKWTGTIKKLRLDPLDFSDDDLKSSIEPQAFTDEFDIKIAAISLVRESNTADSAGAFLPLADIADSTAGQGNGFLKGSWESEFNNTSVTNTAASRAIVNGEPQASDINKSRTEVIKSITPASYDKSSKNIQDINRETGFKENDDGSLTVTVDNSEKSYTKNGSDPYWDYAGLSINASDVKAIRIKAKIPQIINSNLFQLFFARTEDVETWYNGGDYQGKYLYSDKVYTIYYNKDQVGEDGYYEFYFNISEQNLWNGTIERLRLDPVGFYEAYGSVPAACPNDLMITIKSIELLGYNTTADEEQTSYDSLYFGMTMEHDFYLPTNKLDDKGQPIEFEYIGDDDLWVFIDGELALDLGGCHTAQHGKISFTDGKAYINGGSGTALSSKILETNKVHTLKLFYLERSGSTSSMMIRFNLPEASLTVKNNIECTSKLNTDQQKYFDEKANSKTTTYQVTATAPQGQEQLTSLYYRIGDGDAQKVTLTDGVGTFKLDNGKTAAFTLPVGYSVKVEPIDTAIDRFDYSNTVAITNGGTAVTTQPQTTAQDTLLAYSFTNTYTMQRTDLTIEKQVNKQSEDENRTFIYHIKGNDDDPLTKNIDTRVTVNMGQKDKQDQLINLNAYEWDPHIVIRHDTFSGVNSDNLLNITVNVSGIPEGQEAMIYYRTDSSGALDDDRTIRVIKTDASDELVFNVKNVISKNGHNGIIQELRFDPMTFTIDSSVDKDFKINFVTFNFADGTSKVFDTRTFAGFKECFDLNSAETSGEVGNDMRYTVTTGDITVNNGSVKINGLPVGSYTVTEEKSWAWRHLIGDVVFNNEDQTVTDNGVTIALPKQENNLLTFYNNTTYNK
ncbi:MAG: fibro-slime domain-containing protein, partial [Acutalibacteraceae bacterium]